MSYKEFCETLARKAGSIMLQYFDPSLKHEIKEDRTPLTVADTQINSLVIEEINKAYPSHDVLGEEESSMKNNSSLVWVCDPIDGTIPFAHGVSTAVFSLALVDNGVPIVGVIYDPFMDRLYYAEKGTGCYLNGSKILVSDASSVDLNVVGVISWKDAPFNVEKVRTNLIDKGATVLYLGCGAYSGMLVASGEFAGLVVPGKYAHDFAAIKILIEEAGGVCTDLFGNDQRYDCDVKGFIAGNKEIHSQLVSLAKEFVSE